MKNLSYLFVLSAIVLLNSCAYSDEFKEINHNNQFVISLPSYLKSCNDLTENADLQYKNAYRNTYCLVRVIDKENKSFENYQQESINVIRDYEPLKNALVTDSAYRENETFRAIDIQLYGLMDNENIYYWHSVFETDSKFYEVVGWTRSMDRKQRYGPDIEKIITSFKPLA